MVVGIALSVSDSGDNGYERRASCESGCCGTYCGGTGCELCGSEYGEVGSCHFAAGTLVLGVTIMGTKEVVSVTAVVLMPMEDKAMDSSQIDKKEMIPVPVIDLTSVV